MERFEGIRSVHFQAVTQAGLEPCIGPEIAAGLTEHPDPDVVRLPAGGYRLLYYTGGPTARFLTPTAMSQRHFRRRRIMAQGAGRAAGRA